MTFGTLALIVAAGLLGPVVAALPWRSPPAVVGEILAGLVIGASGLDWIDTTDPTLVFFSAIGFALLMFIVGTHLPLRDPRLVPALGRGSLVAATVAVPAVGLGLALGPHVGLDRPAVLAVLLTTSSAAVALPVLQELGLDRPHLLRAAAWIALADIATVLAVPLVMATGGLGRVAVGGAIVVGVAVLVWLAARRTADRDSVVRVRAMSKARGWALDLRLSLLMLFTLAWLADRFGTSILVAGFAAGAVVALQGEPRRVAQQLIGVGEGFFVPIFFIDLGARLDLGALVHDAASLRLAAALLVGATACHLLAATVWRLPLDTGMLATAQLGVPSAVATVGLSTHLLTQAQAAAIMAAVLGSLLVASIGASRLGGGRRPITDHAAPPERA